ncbi:MAG: NUDIX domain-containing protein [Desulfarculaceae bacterium]
MTYSTDQEILAVVDAEDRIIDTRTRGEIHQGGLLHRAVHILVLDAQGRIYLQRRSANKDSHPHKWTSSASGHVDAGEDYAQAAVRELKEELNLDLPLTRVGKLPASAATDNEFSEVFLAIASSPPRPNPQEISQGEFFEVAKALDLARDHKQAAPGLLPVLELWLDSKATGS